jgi:rhamnogalacturonan endolyase
MLKSSGNIVSLSLDGRNLLGTGKGLYLDCYCTPAGFYTPGSSNAKVKSLNGTDATGTSWGGLVLQDTYPTTGQLFEQYWFLRDGEAGLHSFSRVAYYNETVRSVMRLLQRSFLIWHVRPHSSAISVSSEHCFAQPPISGRIYQQTVNTGHRCHPRKLLVNKL